MMYKFAKREVRKIYKLTSSLHDSCIAVGSLSKVKDAMTEIKTILNRIEGFENGEWNEQ